MAKIVYGIVHLSGTMGDFCFVRRKSGDYLRRKRGTVKPATINEALQSNTDRNKPVNKTAKSVNNIMKIYASYFREGAFWNRLQTRIRKCPDDELTTHLNSLAGLELNEQHRFTRLTEPSYSIESVKGGFTVQLDFSRHPDYGRNKGNCYYYELVAVLWIKGMKEPIHRSIETNWVSFNDPVPYYEIYFERPPRTTHYLLAIKLEAGNNNIAEYMMWGKAMMILGGGKF